MSSVALKTTSTASQAVIHVAGTTGTAGVVTISLGPQTHGSASTAARGPKDLEAAVYAFLQAMRSLGRTHVTPEDVANGLGISASSAMAALSALQSKGVRRSK
jgi:CRP-like cAMP-binding protein